MGWFWHHIITSNILLLLVMVNGNHENPPPLLLVELWFFVQEHKRILRAYRLLQRRGHATGKPQNAACGNHIHVPKIVTVSSTLANYTCSVERGVGLCVTRELNFSTTGEPLCLYCQEVELYRKKNGTGKHGSSKGKEKDWHIYACIGQSCDSCCHF